MFARDPEKMETFVGADSSFKGELKVKGTLRVDGSVEGSLNADCVVLSENATVKGEIQGKKIIVGGKVEGNLHAQGLVEIKPKGRVWGDVFTPKLAMSEGAEYNGRIEMKKGEAAVIDLPLKVKEG